MNQENTLALDSLPLPSWRELLLYFLGILFAFCLVLMTLFLLMRSVEGVYWNNTAQTLRAWIGKKSAIAAELPSPKIILLGGSNVFYGMRADLLSQKLSVPVINFGLHGALPLSFYIYELDKIAHPDDLVVFAPEYNYYFLNPWGVNQESLRYLFFDRQDFLISSGLLRFIKILFQAPPDFYFARILHPSTTWHEAVESEEQKIQYIMNALGDYQINLLKDRSERQFAELQSGKPVEELTKGFSADYLMGLAEINFFPFLQELQSWAGEKQVGLVFTWPNIQQSSHYETNSNKEFFQRFHAHIEFMGVKVIDSPFNSMLPQSEFYDTIYHLHQEAAYQRTHKFVESLAPLIEEWNKRKSLVPAQKE